MLHWRRIRQLFSNGSQVGQFKNFISRLLLWSALAALLVSFAAPPPARAASPPERPNPNAKLKSGQILVKFRGNLNPTLGSRLAGAAEAAPLSEVDHLHVQRLRVPPGREREFVERLAKSPFVEYAEPDYLVSAQVMPDDPAVTNGQQWHLTKIDASAAWDVTTGADNPVTIAIVDTGIDGTHPDLAGRVGTGFNGIVHQPIPAGTNSDDYWHGTHVAGIAAADGNNGIGGAGISWGATLMPVKILDATGYGTYSDLAEGIMWAVDHGARVINMSLGGQAGTADETNTLTAAINYAWQKGALLVAAAGNEGNTGNPLDYPAALDHVLSVAATTAQDQRASFSNYNRFVGVAAPGSGIYSTIPGGGYASHSGTSMATPIVSGLAALLLSANPSLSGDQLTGRLESTAIQLGDPGRNDYYGYGRVSAGRALLTGALAVSSHQTYLDLGQGAAGSAVITVTSQVSGTVAWQAQSGAAWLKVAGSSTQGGRLAAQSSSQITITPDYSRRPAGVYTGTIQVGAPLGTDLVSPQTVEVDLVSPRLFLPALGRNAAPVK